MLPLEAHPYILATGLMAVIFFAAMVRLWLLRRVEASLLKSKEALEKQVVTQQKDLMQVRSDANAWRTEMQRQFDLFRHMASDQLKVEETRFDSLLNKSRDRERDLVAELEIARRLCAELPAAKARVMQLESLLGVDAGEGLVLPEEIASPAGIAPLPDLNGAAAAPAPIAIAAVTGSAETTSSSNLEEVSALKQEIIMLKQALAAEKLRNRIRERTTLATKTKSRRN